MVTEIHYKNHGPNSLETMPYLHVIPSCFEVGDLEKSLEDSKVKVEVHAALVNEYQPSITNAAFGFLSGQVGPKYFSNGRFNLAYVVLSTSVSPRNFKFLQKRFGDKKNIIAVVGELVQRDPLRGIRGPKDYMQFLFGVVKEILEKGKGVSIHSYEQDTDENTSPYLLRALETLVTENEDLKLVLSGSNQ